MDEAIAGTGTQRDGLNGLLVAAAKGQFKTVIIPELSRLARESVTVCEILRALVVDQGVRVISIGDGLDSDQSGRENAVLKR